MQEGTAHGGGPDAEASDDLFLGIVESSMEGDGWNMYVECFYHYTDPTIGGKSVDDIGFVFQGGAWVARQRLYRGALFSAWQGESPCILQ